MQGKKSTFDAFKTSRYFIWCVMVNPQCVNESTCSCPTFLKAGECKHSLGMLIRMKMVNVPPAAKNVALGQKRKRERPSLAKKALMDTISFAHLKSHYFSILNFAFIEILCTLFFQFAFIFLFFLTYTFYFWYLFFWGAIKYFP